MYLFWIVWLCSWSTDQILHRAEPCSTFFLFLDSWAFTVSNSFAHPIWFSFCLRLWRWFTVDTICCRSGRVPIQPIAMVPAGPLHSQDFHAVGRDVGVYNSTVNGLCFVFVSHVICSLRGGSEVVNNWHWNLKPNQKNTTGFVGRFHQTYHLLVPFLHSISPIQSLLGWSYIAYWPYKVAWTQAGVTGLTLSWYLLV